MLVWIVNPFDNLPGEGFRPGRYSLMAEAFRRAGHGVVWFSSDFSHTRKRRRELEGIPDWVRLVPTCAYSRNVSPGRIFSQWLYARRFRALALAEIAAGRKPDLIVVSVPPLSTADAACDLAKRTGARLVADFQDAWPETFGRLLPRPLAFLGGVLFAPMRRAVRRLCRMADAVTGVCDRYGELVRGYGARDYRRFYLGIAAEKAVPRSAAPSGNIRLAYVGNLGRSYDLKTVVGALSLLHGATLEVAADEVPRTEGAVIRRGYLAEGDLREMLSGCDIGVIPMSDDSWVGLPNKLFDYAAAGLRIVSSLGGECAEFLKRNRLGVTYRAGDAADFARAVREAMALPVPFELPREISAAAIYGEYVDYVTR